MARALCRSAALLAALWAFGAAAARDDVLWQAVQARQAPFLEALKEFVETESGSADPEGLERLATRCAARLQAAGGQVERLEGGMVKATFLGRGTRSVLLLAHMDTVYPRGALAKQPFRVDGDRAYGLAISDDKQAIATILEAISALRAVGFDGFGRITVLLNADEEVGSHASRALITELGSTHDAALSFEAATDGEEEVSLVTSGLAQAHLKVHGESAHPANFDKLGVNALLELVHQVGQMNDLPDHAHGLRFNWTTARAGTVVNKIPDEAEANADIRVVEPGQLEALEAKMREHMRNQLLPGARVELEIVPGRPPLAATPANRALALHMKSIAAEIGRPLLIHDSRPRGGTDAAYAGVKARGAVLEHLGVAGANAHSSRDEYITLSSVAPRLYLVARAIMDISRDKVH